MSETQQTPTATTETNMASHFQFPDMDVVYEPYAATNSDAAWSDAGDDVFERHSRSHFADGVNHQPQVNVQKSPYTTYGFDDDQYPQSQMEALHPGGKYYPDQSPQLQKVAMAGTSPPDIEMSGAVPPLSGSANVVEDGATLEKRISASEFEYIDQSAGLARRFARQETGF